MTLINADNIGRLAGVAGLSTYITNHWDRRLGFKVRMEDSKATGQEIENYSLLGFWIEAFREIGMRLERCWFPRSHANVPAPPDDAHFATRMEWMVRDAGLDKPSPEPGIGAYIGFGLKIKSVGHGLGAAFPQELGTVPGGGGGRDYSFEMAAGHAVALFRFSGKANGPLFFMDPNCGVYHIHSGKLSAFLQAWVRGYEESPFMMANPVRRSSGVVSKVETKWTLTTIQAYFVGLKA